MSNVDKLNYDYTNVIGLRNQIVSIFDALNSKLLTLEHMYIDFVRVHNTSNDLFGTDSVSFSKTK